MTMNDESRQDALDTSGRRLDQIRLSGITAFGYHGVFEHERREGQTFVADVVVHLDTRRAAARDDLAHTLNYGELAEQVAAVLAGEPVDLIETVAERIAATVLASGIVQAVDVAVHKPKAPIQVPFGDVVVAIHRDRTKLPAAEPYVPARGRGGRAGVAPGADGDGVVPGHPGARRRGRSRPAPRVRAAAWADAVAPAPGAFSQGPDGPSAELEPVPAGEALVVGEVVTDALDQAPDGPVEVVLALGANLGPAQDTLREAVTDLARTPGIEVRDVSALARTSAVGGPEQSDYLNAVVLARTTLAPRALLRATQAIEHAHGRERHEHWGPRTLDIDIVLYGSVLAVTDDLELPHPRAHERAFVLQPWAQVDPDAVLPGLGGGPVGALAATAPDRDGVRWLALDWLTTAIPAVSGDTGAVPAAVRRPRTRDAPHALADAPAGHGRRGCRHVDRAARGRGPRRDAADRAAARGRRRAAHRRGRVLHGLGRPAVPARQAAAAEPDPGGADGGAGEGVLLHRRAARRLVRRPGAGAGRRPERAGERVARDRGRHRDGRCRGARRSSVSSSSGSAGCLHPRPGAEAAREHPAADPSAP